jgi:uncharacterized protein YciI
MLLGLAGAALVLGSACGTVRTGDGSAPELAALTLALVQPGEALDPGDGLAEREVFDAHRRFLEREAEAGRLLVTGPFAPAEGAPRGLLLFDVEDPGVVSEILEEDPAVAAGLLRPEVFPLITLAQVRELPAMEQRRVSESGGVGGDSRRFVVLIAPDGEAAVEWIQHPAIAQEVLLLAQLGEPTPGGLLVVLGFESIRELIARRRIAGASGPPGTEDWQVWEWFSTPALGAFAFDGAASQPPRSSASK